MIAHRFSKSTSKLGDANLDRFDIAKTARFSLTALLALTLTLVPVYAGGSVD